MERAFWLQWIRKYVGKFRKKKQELKENFSFFHLCIKLLQFHSINHKCKILLPRRAHTSCVCLWRVWWRWQHANKKSSWKSEWRGASHALKQMSENFDCTEKIFKLIGFVLSCWVGDNDFDRGHFPAQFQTSLPSPLTCNAMKQYFGILNMCAQDSHANNLQSWSEVEENTTLFHKT